MGGNKMNKKRIKRGIAIAGLALCLIGTTQANAAGNYLRAAIGTNEKSYESGSAYINTNTYVTLRVYNSTISSRNLYNEFRNIRTGSLIFETYSAPGQTGINSKVTTTSTDYNIVLNPSGWLTSGCAGEGSAEW